MQLNVNSSQSLAVFNAQCALLIPFFFFPQTLAEETLFR